MFTRLYAIFGGLLLAGYSAAMLEGWEFTNPTRHGVPGMYASGSGSGGSSWWRSSSSRSGIGGGRGGK